MVKGFQECSVMLTLLEDLWPHQNTPDVEKKQVGKMQQWAITDNQRNWLTFTNFYYSFNHLIFSCSHLSLNLDLSSLLMTS